MEDLLVLVISVFCGLLFIYLGYLIWIKKRINLIHSYHYTYVKEVDKKAYTSIMGKAVIVIGTGIILSGIFYMIFRSGAVGIIFGISFVAGFIMMAYAQMKYNR